MSILSYLKQKFQEQKEQRQAENDLRSEAEQQFPAFHEVLFGLPPARIRTDNAAVYRTSWKRAVVLTCIYREKGLDREVAIHDFFKRWRLENFGRHPPIEKNEQRKN